MIPERRCAVRYRLALPVQLEGATGTTRDMSTAGVFFVTAKAHSVGDAIEFSVDFSDVAVKCKGRVVRVEQVDNKFGVAVALQPHVLMWT